MLLQEDETQNSARMINLEKPNQTMINIEKKESSATMINIEKKEEEKKKKKKKKKKNKKKKNNLASMPTLPSTHAPRGQHKPFLPLTLIITPLKG